MFWIGGFPKPNLIEQPHFQKGVDRIRRVVRTKRVSAHASITPLREYQHKAYDAPPEPQGHVILTVKELMNPDVFTLTPEHTTEDARQLLFAQRIHHVPIVDGENRLLGLITDHDLLRAAVRELDEGPLLLGDIMTTKVLACDKDTSIRAAAGVMARRHIHCMPVVDEEGGLMGLFTTTDILGCLVNNTPLDLYS